MLKRKKKKEHWKQNVAALWIGNFATGAGTSMSLPFLPLFITNLGNFSHKEITLYTGIAFSITFLSQAIISPIWGKLADRTGRKTMLLRAAIGMTITATLSGLSPNIWVLIILRLIHGFFSGYINNAYALVASDAPQEHNGEAMGKLTTGAVSGQLTGPVFGGIIAGTFGYRIPFFFFGILMAIATIITYLCVQENFTASKVEKIEKIGNVFSDVKNIHIIWAMFLSSMLIQAATNSINPIISLFVQQLMNHKGNVALISGIIVALPGLGTLLTASHFGHLGDRIGPKKILLAGLLISGILFFQMYFVKTTATLAILRFLIGVADAALIPMTQIVMSLNTPSDSISRVFSYNQSFQAIGSVVGPMMTALVAGFFSYPDVFLMTTSLVIVNLAVVWWSYAQDAT
ncbi:MFS transporter [Leuconostoc citreum]|uniref:MFS transporter n=1 Tax=Leuconostoc citreum TaxID=33964 RepID=UPI0011BBB21B|nr:MFS transporter [Leuconostoc citreum]QEA37562.1 multidrug efflux MFS transporter [Leuconostoc citreum]